MSRISRLARFIPSKSSVLLAVAAALLLILSFPDFGYWPMAFVAPLPLYAAIAREKESAGRAFVTGWIFGLLFFFGTCSWLTFAPITYAHLPSVPVYFLMLCVAGIVGVFPGLFGAVMSFLMKRVGTFAVLAAPFVWIFSEFLRMFLTGNNWNSIGYSQAFAGLLKLAPTGGIYLVGFGVLVWPTLAYFLAKTQFRRIEESRNRGLLIAIIVLAFGWLAVVNLSVRKGIRGTGEGTRSFGRLAGIYFLIAVFGLVPFLTVSGLFSKPEPADGRDGTSVVVAIQPNVPMDGISFKEFEVLLARHVELAENALRDANRATGQPVTIIFPESPMIFQYARDPDLQVFLRDFAVRNNASVVFNSAEPTPDGNRLMNSAVMVDASGEKSAQYDKIHLLPFGEYIPFPEPLASLMPAFVGNFEFGNEYDLLPLGDAKGGVMICFESHFGELSREYTLRGADVLIEMTNDGYLGKTPVLRQHLANSVFRAAETRRPLLRVTNVGVTAYIDENGVVSGEADVYAEATRVWTVAKSDGRQTFYVRFGDWFAWLSAAVSVLLLVAAFRKRPAGAN